MPIEDVRGHVDRASKRIEGGAHDGVVPGAEIEVAPGHELTAFHPVQQAYFLQELKRSPIVGRAARAAGVTVAQCYAMRKRSETFAAAWDESLIEAVDDLEQVAVERATSKSDRLLELLLKGHRPETYRDKLDVALASRVDIVVDLVPGLPGPHVESVEPGDIDGEAEILDP